MKLKSFLLPITEAKVIFSKIIIFWPSTPFGTWLRRNYYGRYMRSMGINNVLESGVRFGVLSIIDMGSNCIFGRNVNINSGNCKGIFIGDGVAISNGAYIRSAIHRFDRIDLSILDQGYKAAEILYRDSTYSIVIEDGVWIGSYAIILSGAHIGEGSMISAGALVTNKIPPYSIVVGNPGRVIGNRKKNLENNEKI